MQQKAYNLLKKVHSKKFFFLLLSFLMFLALSIQLVQAEGADVKNYVWLEGENAVKFGDYKATNDTRASGTKQLKLDSTDTTKTNKADFSFNVTSSGTYAVWVLSTRGDTNYVSKYKWSMDDQAYKNVVQSNTTNAAYTTADYRAVPMYWNKLAEVNLDKNTVHKFSVLTDAMRTMTPQFYLHELDVVVIVPVEWSWEPYGLNKPFDKTSIKVDYLGGAVSTSSVDRNTGVSVTVRNKVTQPAQGSVKIYAEWAWKGQTVYRVSKDTAVPIQNWQVGTSYADVITLPAVPFNASDSNYEIRTGFEGVSYQDQEANKKVGDVTVGNPTFASKLTGVASQLNVSPTVQRGSQLSGSVSLSVNQPVSFNTKGYLTIWKGDVLWGVKEIPGVVETSTWNVGVVHPVSFTVDFPDDGLPEGTYIVKYGLHQLEVAQYSLAQTTLSGVTYTAKTYKPLTYGNFYAKKDGKTNFWYVNQNHAMFWNGEPYIPVGGMFCSNYIMYFDEKSPDKNLTNWNKDLVVLQTMESKGIMDLYLNCLTGSTKVPAWAWQYLTDYLDSHGFHYGLQLTGGTPEASLTNAYMIHANEAGGTYKVENVTASGNVSLDIPASAVRSIKTANSTLFVVIDTTTGQVVQSGQGTATLSSDATKFTVAANVVLPSNSSHTVFFIPQVTFTAANLGNLWDGGEAIKQKLSAFADRIDFGSNFRLFVDPFLNEASIVNQYESLKIDSPAYRAQYAAWMAEKYGNTTALSEAWHITPAISSFDIAARLVPMTTGSAGSSWADTMYLLDPQTGSVYTADARHGVLWDDHTDFYYTSFLDFNNDLADSLSLGADVPVLYKHTGLIKKYFINDRLYGGFDGIGGEIYGDNEDVLRMKTGWGYSEAEQSKKTTWFIITETELEEDVNKKVASGLVAYPSQEKMHSNFDCLFAGGAKGLFDFVIYAPHDSRLNNFYSYYPAKPVQFDWLYAYKTKLLAAASLEALMGSRPDVYYVYPAGQMWWMNPTIRTAALPGDDYRGAGSLKASNGKWVMSTNTLDVDTKVLLISLENDPATTVWGDAIRNTDLKNGTRTTVYMGLRKNLGALPEIDAYFTPETVQLENGDTVQVLQPTATSQILYSTADGKVWGLRDGNLWIIANANWMFGNDLNNIKYIGDWNLEADTTSPTTLPETEQTEVNGWYTTDVTVSFSAQDNLSGVAQTLYKIDNSADWSLYRTPITLSAEGTHLLQYYSVDRAGNAEEVKAKNVNIDKTSPSFTLEVDGAAFPEGGTIEDFQTVILNTIDSTSGVTIAAITVDGKMNASADSIQSSGINLDLAGLPGERTIRITVQDIAGNKLEQSCQITVATSIASMNQIIARFEKSGDLKQPLVTILNNILKHEQRMLDKGRPDIAVKLMEHMLTLLDTKKFDERGLISGNAAAVLSADGEWLKNVWAGMPVTGNTKKDDESFESILKDLDKIK